MRSIRNIACIALLIFATACSTAVVGPVSQKPASQKKAPPGQVKKATGSQSAKPYAPGQQKKKK
ncbi:quinol oxidase subunit 4 [Chryseolinea lacunae]|uniref:Quinol oxidase subunit 4 n=1 Tax=Chryseolinea lacunae TaxID=2801331 RepID=A0ABS1KNW9_9BACT|nr:quinol oxidase subunit 4 [Chryseolinea lacunae]MBL0740937.1 quinol oxidase subunit 4 [Chryseolinea lacunae]